MFVKPKAPVLSWHQVQIAWTWIKCIFIPFVSLPYVDTNYQIQPYSSQVNNLEYNVGTSKCISYRSTLKLDYKDLYMIYEKFNFRWRMKTIWSRHDYIDIMLEHAHQGSMVDQRFNKPTTLISTYQKTWFILIIHFS